MLETNIQKKSFLPYYYLFTSSLEYFQYGVYSITVFSANVKVLPSTEMNINLKRKLETSGEKEEIDELLNGLSSGGDINARIDDDQNTMLHVVSSAEVANLLLSNGANVNIVNIDGDTPLHSAISRRKGISFLDLLVKYGANVNMKNNYGQSPLHSSITDKNGFALVRELLKNGANVNATDNKGNSVLFLAVKYYKNLEIIKMLIDFDADIKMRSSSLNRFFTPLDVAVRDGDLSCAKLLIKMTVIKNFHKDFRKISDLESHINAASNSKLTLYLNDCFTEIILMKREEVNNIYSVYDVVVKNFKSIKPLYSNSIILNKNNLQTYYIYKDIILNILKLSLQRGDLLDKLKESEIFFEPLRNILPIKVKLNGDCLYKIGELLSNDDLMNFVNAINIKNMQSFYFLDYNL